ncbi:MAG: hypothetical protein WCK27_24545 [Verrucomicrobiota bacterium]
MGDPFMFPNTFILLQNEGFLMQGCLKASLAGILAGTNAQPGPLYAAFFNYAIGMERLLKILLLLDKWHCEHKFPTNDELRTKGHKLQHLHSDVLPLFQKYGVPWELSYGPDKINTDLLSFLSDFANGSRYYNLNALADGTAQAAKNPIYRWQRLFYETYKQDYPNPEPIKSKPDMPEDAMSMSQLTGHHIIIAATRPHLCWRMVQLLVPLKELLIALREQVHKDDLARAGSDADPSVPYMEEFLQFVCSHKEALNSEAWPYQD